MGCCGGKGKRTGMEVEVTFRNGRKERFPDIPSARLAITASGGGTYKMVAKSSSETGS